MEKIQIKDLNKIEFWAASLIYACAILMLISNGSNAYSQTRTPSGFYDAKIDFSYVSNYFLPELFRYSILYFSFLLLNFCSFPLLYKKKNIGFNISMLIAVYLLAGLVISIAATVVT